jgi:heptosyltransferase III
MMDGTIRIAAEDAAAARRILIINVTRIGDTLLATPALRAIARFFPRARMTCLGHPKRVEVVQHLPYLNKVGGITKRHALYRGWPDVLRGPEYDWAFVWGDDAALIRYALRKAKHVVAARQPDAQLNRRLFCAVDAPVRSGIHAVAWSLSLPSAVGIPVDGYRLDYRVTAEESAWAIARLAKAGMTPGGPEPIIGMQVASFPTKAYRDWPIEHFIELTDRIIARWPGARFVLYGSADDQPRTLQLAAQTQGKAVSFAGQLTLRETVAIMQQTDLYIGVDTGPTHLYSALQKPMVALYHPSLPSALFKPLQHAALHVIDHPLAGPKADQTIPIGDITVDTVFAAVAGALAHRPSTHPGMPSPGVDPDAQLF